MGFFIFLLIAAGIGFFLYKRYKAKNEQTAETQTVTANEQYEETESNEEETEEETNDDEESEDSENSSEEDAFSISEKADEAYEDGNYALAVKLYKKAAEIDKFHVTIYAYYNLGECYRYGKGVPKNIEKAIQWYQKDQDTFGNGEAKKALKEIKGH
jgi:tetratricopeptide (TPR) repeat protein